MHAFAYKSLRKYRHRSYACIRRMYAFAYIRVSYVCIRICMSAVCMHLHTNHCRNTGTYQCTCIHTTLLRCMCMHSWHEIVIGQTDRHTHPQYVRANSWPHSAYRGHGRTMTQLTSMCMRSCALFACAHAYMYTWVGVFTHTHMCTYMYIYTYAYAYTYIHL
jgi:hypothetical protein